MLSRPRSKLITDYLMNSRPDLRYCNSVEAAAKPSKNAPSRLAPALLASLEDLNERLTGTPSANPSQSFGGRKAKGGAGLGSWIEGRLTKFIAGEDGDATPKPIAPVSKDQKSEGPVGPFSHFSTISPAASGAVSRVESTGDFGSHLGSYSEPQRVSPVAQQNQWKPEHSQDQTSYGDQYASGFGSTWQSWSGDQELSKNDDEQQDTNGDEPGEFINPMAAMSFGAPKAPEPADHNPAKGKAPANDFEEEDDDLGFGNSSLSRGRTPKPAPEGPAATTKADDKSTAKNDSPADSTSRPEPPKGEFSFLCKDIGADE